MLASKIMYSAKFQLRALWIILSIVSRFGVGVSQAQQLHKSMSLGVDSIHAGEKCLILGARAEAGDFFAGLRKRRTKKGETFLDRAGHEIKWFPSQLVIKVDAAIDTCVG